MTFIQQLQKTYFTIIQMISSLFQKNRPENKNTTDVSGISSKTQTIDTSDTSSEKSTEYSMRSLHSSAASEQSENVESYLNDLYAKKNTIEKEIERYKKMDTITNKGMNIGKTLKENFRSSKENQLKQLQQKIDILEKATTALEPVDRALSPSHATSRSIPKPEVTLRFKGRLTKKLEQDQTKTNFPGS